MVKEKKRRIVVLGAGYVGISTVQTLANKLDLPNHEIVLIDKYSCHVYQGDLYEVATALHAKISNKCLTRLKETVATPVTEFIKPDQVKFVCDEVLEIDQYNKVIKLKKEKNLDYDYLVVGLGSSNNFFGIPGLEENALTLKTVEDALKINCKLDQYFYHLWNKQKHEDVDIVVGGGGAAGVELAGELVHYVRGLCKKYKYPEKRVKVVLIEGMDRLGGFKEKGTKLVIARLKKLGVELHMKSFISKVGKKSLDLKLPNDKKKSLPYDILVWTGGVKVNPVVAKAFGTKATRGAIEVNPFLQSAKYRNVFAAGDNAFFFDDEGGGRVPMLAQVAWVQGILLAENMIEFLKGGGMRQYKIPYYHLLVPVGGKFAFWRAGDKIFSGMWVWFFKRLIYYRYYLKFLPFLKATHKFMHSTKVFCEND
jgi:NADH:ubiquinone reductase (H+-translocating)